MTDYISSATYWKIRNSLVVVFLLVAVAVWLQGLVSLTPLTWDHVFGALIGLLLIGAVKWL